MSKDSSARYHQKNKEKILTFLVKGMKILLKKKKTKSENMFVKDIKISQKLKNKI